MKKITKVYIFALCSVLLIFPLIIDLIHFNKLNSGFLVESSIFSLDYGRFFSQFFYDKSVFMAGASNLVALPYAPFYGLLYCLQRFFTPVSSFFLVMIAAMVSSYYFFIKLFNEIVEVVNGRKNDLFYYLLSCILGLIFLTSLSNFIFIQATIFFLLPTLILIIQLFFVKRYAVNDEKVGLIFFSILNCFTIFNLTAFLINIFFTNVFFYILLNIRYGKIISKDYFKKAFLVNILYAPFLLLLFLQIVVGWMYIGPIGDVISATKEDFYSMHATFLNTFAQTDCWGLFDGFNGTLYYAFSTFYRNNIVYIFSFIPYIMIAFFLMKTTKQEQHKELNKTILYFLVLFLFTFQFMLGMNNPLYRFLYEKMIVFQIFRDVTKFSPVLLFLTLLILFLLIVRDNIKTIFKKILLLLLISSALLYNIPYWTYATYFFENRSVPNIPQSYLDTANFLNERAADSDNILILPATYSGSGQYSWNNKMVSIQGNIFDVLLDNGVKSYGLTQGFAGSTFFQKDSSKLFVATNQSVRRLDVDYTLLSGFVAKYGLDYVVVTKDLVSEYQNISVLEAWLKNDNYQKIDSFGNNDIYFNKSNFRPILSSDDNISFDRKNAGDYDIHLGNIKKGGFDSLIFSKPFNQYWNLYLRPISGQKSPKSNELSYLFEKPIFNDTHYLVNGYSNGWTIDPNYIKQNFDKSYYKENPDGSIDIELTIYFRPQSYFYLGLITSAVILLGCFAYLGYDFIRRKNTASGSDKWSGKDEVTGK